MARVPSLVLEKKTPDAHAKLTQAHDEAGKECQILHKQLSLLFRLDLPATQKQAIQIGSALQRVALAERGCGACYGTNHTFSAPYEEMLEQHRLAFIDFERMSRELETGASPRCSDIAALAADIQGHLERAENAHQVCLGPSGLKNYG